LSLLTDENSAVTEAKRRKDLPGLPAAGGEWRVASSLVITPLSLLTDENSAVTEAKRRKDLPGLTCGWW